jgi:response regulator RpfG family c-di-GMP phosphodiesterase
LDKNRPALQILLVDDAQYDLDAQRRTLGGCKLLNEIVTFKRGADVLDYLRSAKGSGGKHFLILLDLVMKPDDGTSVLRSIQEEKLGEGSIVVMLSGLSDVRLLHQGYQLGAHTFLVKPLKVQDVTELLNSLKHSIGVVAEPAGNLLVWQAPVLQTKSGRLTGSGGVS